MCIPAAHSRVMAEQGRRTSVQGRPILQSQLPQVLLNVLKVGVLVLEVLLESVHQVGLVACDHDGNPQIRRQSAL